MYNNFKTSALIVIQNDKIIFASAILVFQSSLLLCVDGILGGVPRDRNLPAVLFYWWPPKSKMAVLPDQLGLHPPVSVGRVGLCLYAVCEYDQERLTGRRYGQYSTSLYMYHAINATATRQSTFRALPERTEKLRLHLGKTSLYFIIFLTLLLNLVLY